VFIRYCFPAAFQKRRRKVYIHLLLTASVRIYNLFQLISFHLSWIISIDSVGLLSQSHHIISIYSPWSLNQLLSHLIDFIYINIFYLLIKKYLFLIFIKYSINESRVNIKFLGLMCFVKITLKIIMLWDSCCIKTLFLKCFSSILY
jgi:hypothetical protein